MNRIAGSILVLVGSCSWSIAASLNYVGNGTENLGYTNLQFSGAAGGAAGSVDNIATLNIVSSRFSGGNGVEGALNSSGGSGLFLRDIDNISISNALVTTESVRGGDGADTESTVDNSVINASGGSGVDFSAVGNAVQGLTIKKILAYGGNGGVIDLTKITTSATADGGSGVKSDYAFVTLNNGIFYGGSGGRISAVVGSNIASAKGGDGVQLPFPAGRSVISSLDQNLWAYGGTGGGITNSLGSAMASGGDGMNLRTLYTTVDMNISGGYYEGGRGGIAVGSSVNANAASANGGNGLSYAGSAGLVTDKTMISGGTFIGGAGGAASNSLGTASANGGRGAYLVFSDVRVSGGAFYGGEAGVSNGKSADRGGGLWVQDSVLTITNGTFKNLGLVVEALSRPETTATILGGDFEDVDMLAAATRKTSTSISGGTFSNLFFKGAGTVDATISGGGIVGGATFAGSGQSTAEFNGAGIKEIFFIGSGNSDVSVSSNGLDLTQLTMSGGVATVEVSNDNIQNVSISSGMLDFSGRMLDIFEGDSHSLSGLGVSVNYNDGLTVRDGGSLKVGLGAVNASSLIAEQGATLDVGEGMVDADTFSAADGANIYMALNGSTNGVIKGDSLTFGDANWFLSGSTTETNKIYILAEGSSSNSLTAPVDINWVSSVSGPNWLYGITDVYAQSNQFIKADFGLQSLDRALGVDSASALGKAMADFSLLVSQDSEAWAIASSFSSEEEASRVLRQTYVQTAEMASTLIRQQELYADQIKERTRSFVSHKNYGTSYSLPQGPGGPENWQPEYWYDETKDRLTEALPKPQLKGEPADLQKPYMSSKTKADGNVYDSVKDTVHRIFPSKDVNVAKNMRSFEEKSKPYVADVDVPASYQVWGRVFSSWYDQKAVQNFAGYDAMVYGATIGADRRFDHLMVGLGGGFADTTLDGNAGNNGDALSGYGTVYAAFSKGSWYLDLNVNGAVSSVKTESSPSFNYTGDFDAYSAGLYIGSGYSVELFGKGIYGMVLTPEVSLLSTYYSQEAYDETSSTGGAPVKSWDEYDQGSYLSSVGVTLSQSHKIQSFKMEMEFKPEVRAHWLHEFNADMDAPSYVMAGGANRVGVALQPREEDLLKVGAGIRFNSWYSDALEFGLDLDGTFGEDYSAYIVSGKLLHRF